MTPRNVFPVIAAMAACAAVVWAQVPATTTAPQPVAAIDSSEIPEGGMPAYIHTETPEQRKARLGTPEDPGTNPDPNKHFWRFGHSYHISKYERQFAVYDREPGTVRPIFMVNFAFEIYQQNEKSVWVWMLDRDPAAEAAAAELPPTTSERWGPDQIAFLKRIRSQFDLLNPPSSEKTIVFQESSDGLPKSGSWRNSLAVADMNEDGCPDIIAPPERKGNGLPVIFLGDCKGHWKVWQDVKWPHSLDYGGVVAADFNKDGHMDLAFAVHLNGVYVFLGDGKGNFTESSDGLPRDFSTRRLVAVDVNGDGYPDLAVESEGPSAASGMESGQTVNVRLYVNRDHGKRWELTNITKPGQTVGGDWLSVGEFNGDGRPDFVTASVYFNSYDVIQLSNGPMKWSALPSDGDLLPSLSYYFASTTGKFNSKKVDDVILNYEHYWPQDLDPRLVQPPEEMTIGAVDRISFTKQGAKRYPIIRWREGAVAGMASGDFDGDGNLDVIFTRSQPRDVVVLLGDGRGGFSRAKLEGISLPDNRNYDIKVADVNLDGRPDVILMYETASSQRAFNSVTEEKNGSIVVFLNRGAKPKAAEAKKAGARK